MKKLVLAAVAALALVSVGNAFAGQNASAKTDKAALNDTVDTVAPQTQAPVDTAVNK